MNVRVSRTFQCERLACLPVRILYADSRRIGTRRYRVFDIRSNVSGRTVRPLERIRLFRVVINGSLLWKLHERVFGNRLARLIISANLHGTVRARIVLTEIDMEGFISATRCLV